MGRVLPSITIGICTKNNEQTIAKMLQSILKLKYPKSLINIVIVDGMSTDKTLKIIERFLTEVNLKWKLLSDYGRGLGYARQLIVMNTDDELIAFVDADQYLHPEWLQRILSIMLNNSKVGAIRGAQGVTYNLPLPAALENYIKAVEDAEAEREAKAEYFAIGGSIVRKKAIIQVGGFDPSFKMSAEDTDLAARLKKANWMILNSADSIFYHVSRQSWRELYKQYRNFGIGFRLATKKHGDIFRRISFSSLLFFSLATPFLGIFWMLKALKATHDLVCILMPLHYIYKRVAWLNGYLSTPIRKL